MGDSVSSRGDKSSNKRKTKLTANYEQELKKAAIRRKNRKYYEKNRERLKKKNLENYYRRKRRKEYEKIANSSNRNIDANN